jgi:triacylglycerol lipase
MGSAIGTRASKIISVLHPDVYRHLFHLPLMSYVLFVPRKARVRAARHDGFPPVILVHGLGGSRGDLLPIECYLKFFGRRRIYRINLNTKQSLGAMSRSLSRFVERVLKANGAEKADIVAHSLGGIVARLAINDPQFAPRVRTLVTMGTPHQGTVPARFMDTRLTRALHPNSPVMRKLKKSEWPKGVRGVAFWSKNDLIVLPPESAVVDGASPVDMSPFTHFSYLIDPRSWAAIRKILDQS